LFKMIERGPCSPSMFDAHREGSRQAIGNETETAPHIMS
jgi:hypothetical protein